MTDNKTESEVRAMLERESNSWVAVRSTDKYGDDESYGTAEIGAILETLDDYEFEGVEPADGIDIDVWAQDFSRDIREGLRKDLANGRLYVARFRSGRLGGMDLLLWD